jgi:hypothetical protein
VFKFQQEWTNKTPKGVSILFTHPSNRFDLPFRCFSGFVDTDKYNLPVHFPFILKKGFEGIIPAGTPVAQLFPIKRTNWKSKVVKWDADESYKANRNFQRTFAASYKKNYWNRKEYS